ncbi:MAG: translocation/assembly module TamB [Prevotellaceae bacterium]|nr:translocation/assembly module TamB [Prevotellaceae bacterium]
MQKLKSLLRWTVGVLIAAYLVLALVISLPAAQTFLARRVSALLSEQLGAKAEIGRIQLGFNGRIIADGLSLEDRQGETLLEVSRAGARISLWQLLEGKIRLGNVQLFGVRASLYQQSPGEKPNFWFVVDAFQSNDSTSSTPVDLRVGQLLVRRTSVRWEQRWREETPGRLNTGHVALENLNITAELNALTQDTLDIEFKRLNALESHSGLRVKELSFNLTSNKDSLSLSDFHLALPRSTLDIPRLLCSLGEGSLPVQSILLQAKGQIDSKDLRPLLPSPVNEIDERLSFELGAEGTIDDIRVDTLRIADTFLDADISLQARLFNLSKGLGQTIVEANVQQSSLNPGALAKLLNVPLLEKTGKVSLRGAARAGKGSLTASADLSTPLGDVSLKGTLSEGEDGIEAEITTSGLELGSLLSDQRLGTASLSLKAKGSVDGGLKISGTVPSLSYQGYTFTGIGLDAVVLAKAEQYEGSIEVADPNLNFKAEGKVDLRGHVYAFNATVADFAPNALGLTERFQDTRFSGSLSVDLTGNVLDSIDGKAFVDGFTMLTEEGIYRPGDLHLTATRTDGVQRISVISPFLEASLKGSFSPKNLARDARALLVSHIPTMTQTALKPQEGEGEYCSFTAKLYDTRPLQRLMGINLSIDRPLTLEGSVDTEGEVMGITADIPHLTYGGEDIRDLSLRVEGYDESLLASLRMKRLMKGVYVDFGLDASGAGDELTTKFFWDNNSVPALNGEVSVQTLFSQDAWGQYHADARVLPSSLTTGDTEWQVYAGAFSYSDGVLQVDSLSLGSEGHGLAVRGRASRSEGDTLRVSLREMSLDNIFSLVNFHAVDFSGDATGEVFLCNLFTKPYVETHFTVPGFALNGGVLGDLDMRGNWGGREYSLYIDGHITSDGTRHSRVHGYVTPKTDVPYHGIDLSIDADSLSIEFLNKYTSGIFDRMLGHASGYARLFGPLKQLDIEGGLLVHEGSLGVPMTGVRYYVRNDSVLLSPGLIAFRGATIYDSQGSPSRAGHRATLDGTLRHSHFSNLSFDIGITGEELLAYDFGDFGDLPFCGRVIASGDITLKGSPGSVVIGIKAQPQRGSWLTYDFTSPDNVSENLFVSYIDHKATYTTTEGLQSDNRGIGEAIPSAPVSDIRINFDLNLDANSTFKLLMDARSGDMISLQGNGHILARYYNKGDMQIYGTYRVEKGTYNLSLQEIIHKDFTFTEGGSITFSGEPTNADLNLQASHTVSGVSLNDLSARSTFSNTSARVNCLMNITGKASQPNVSFDLDILNVNEDEKQMVRSLISTDEERNMQVIYLLGIGRFYTYDYSNDSQSQGSTAMNSLLSSTLSGQLNQMLSNMIGSNKWSVGTNLNTGDTGWSDLDVEGILQGSLLNDRLLINGNFGYRDNPVSSSNFIGDFDMQYRLTKAGTVSLKAYNKTNDRYFTKSSLTTQGVGVLLKKDFSTLRELFIRRGKRKQ